jgi:hypothetical protein
MTIKRLATLIAIDRTTLATNLKPLERQGLLAIAPAEDRRARSNAPLGAREDRVHFGFMSELLDLVLNAHGGLSEGSHVSNRA